MKGLQLSGVVHILQKSFWFCNISLFICNIHYSILYRYSYMYYMYINIPLIHTKANDQIHVIQFLIILPRGIFVLYVCMVPSSLKGLEYMHFFMVILNICSMIYSIQIHFYPIMSCYCYSYCNNLSKVSVRKSCIINGCLHSFRSRKMYHIVHH